MTKRILIEGIETEARHGVHPREKEEPQRFVVDLDLTVDPASDSLEATVDYSEAIAEARAAVEEGEPVDLLETLADVVAIRVGAMRGVVSCRAIVHKAETAASLGLTDLSAEATRP